MFAVMGFISSISVYVSQYTILGYEISGADSCLAMRIGLAVTMSILGLHMLSSFMLLWAAYKGHHLSMLPYIWFTSLIVIVHLGGTSGALYLLLAMRVPYVPMVPFVALTLSLVNGVVSLYCLLVVISNYQDLKVESKRYTISKMSDINKKPIPKAEENDYV